MKFSWWNVLLTQFSRPLPVASEDLSEQTVVILGANTGLGFEAAKHFARMEPGRLILACRSQSKGAEALDSEDTFTSRSSPLRADLGVLSL